MKRPPRALKTLLWVSELKENRAKEDFQRARRALSELEEMLREITERPKAMYASLEGRTVGGAELQNFAWGLEMILEEKQKVEKILVRKRQEVEGLREKALRLHQKKRTAEVLHEKAWRHYFQELEKEEAKQLEDLIIMRRKRHEAL